MNKFNNLTINKQASFNNDDKKIEGKIKFQNYITSLIK